MTKDAISMIRTELNDNIKAMREQIDTMSAQVAREI